MNSEVILDLEKRLFAIENLHYEDTIHITNIEKQREIDQSRIVDLQKQQKTHQSRITHLEKQERTCQCRIADLEKQRETDQSHFADLKNQQRIDETIIADLVEQQQQSDQRHISNSENHRVDNQSLINRAYRQQYRQKVLSLHNITTAASADNATRMADERSFPTGNKEATIGHDILNFGLFSSEKNKQGIKKRVSPDYEDMVAFYAVLSRDYNNMGGTADLRFDRIVTNIGNSYSTNTGVFTCPLAGIYVFSWTIHDTVSYAYADLVKNGASVGISFIGDSSFSGVGTGLSVLLLEKGDEIFIRISSHGVNGI
ncbi:caprin-2-like [Ylistrum balloti]|uniref:caprin-2-like n=1 Tax=Ylistrum balloti TaxID=509963 RepID=UPI0029058C04|nr:caprin-2-like [Ylistrum balloti]